jgi:hypothetical protein
VSRKTGNLRKRPAIESAKCKALPKRATAIQRLLQSTFKVHIDAGRDQIVFDAVYVTDVTPQTLFLKAVGMTTILG